MESMGASIYLHVHLVLDSDSLLSQRPWPLLFRDQASTVGSPVPVFLSRVKSISALSWSVEAGPRRRLALDAYRSDACSCKNPNSEVEPVLCPLR